MPRRSKKRAEKTRRELDKLRKKGNRKTVYMETDHHTLTVWYDYEPFRICGVGLISSVSVDRVRYVMQSLSGRKISVYASQTMFLWVARQRHDDTDYWTSEAMRDLSMLTQK